jgi:uncharacterized protein YciI
MRARPDRRGAPPEAGHGTAKLSVPAATVRGMATFVVRMVHGPAWDPRHEIREQVDWDGHAAFLDALVDEGFVLVGGPVGYDEAALLVVESSDEQAVRARLGTDPWVRSGVLRVGTVEPWLIWLKGRMVTAT